MPTSACGDKPDSLVRRCVKLDTAICALLNGTSRSPGTCTLLRVASRLGDGIFWYALMTTLPVIAGREGLIAAAHMAAVSLVGPGIYAPLVALSRLVPGLHYPSDVLAGALIGVAWRCRVWRSQGRRREGVVFRCR